MEASKVSEDISSLNFSSRQLENLVDGLIGIGNTSQDKYHLHIQYLMYFVIGDKNGDKRITFDEYVHMSHDVFVANFAPRTLKRVMRQ